MTRTKRIGYSHAVLATAWFSALALDSNQVVNDILGDGGCAAISLLLALPLTWISGMFVGFPLFPSWTEHIARMTFMGAVVIVNGLLIGYCISWVISRSDNSKPRKIIEKPNKPEMATPRKPSD